MKEIFKKYWYVIIILVCLILLYCIYDNSENEGLKLRSEEIKLESQEFMKEDLVEEKEVNTYFVDIKGEVVKPGVYEIESDKRIINVINKAGGFTKNADTSLLNLSKKVYDEMNIKVYSKKEVQAAKESIKKEPEVIEIIKEIEKECVCPEVNNTCDNKNDAIIEDKDNGDEENNIIDKKEEVLTNINTATKEELMNIPNIGESKANSIIEYRKENEFKNYNNILEKAKEMNISLELLPESSLVKGVCGINERNIVQDTLDALGDKEKQILYLYFLKNMSQEEISIKLNIPIGTVKSRLHYAKEKFKHHYHNNNILKGILETDLLTQDEIIKACELCVKAKADLVKTSTGFVKNGVGAKAEDVEIMYKTVSSKGLQVKASGGIRDYEKALQMINAGASRLGTSSGVKIVNEKRGI